MSFSQNNNKINVKNQPEKRHEYETVQNRGLMRQMNPRPLDGMKFEIRRAKIGAYWPGVEKRQILTEFLGTHPPPQTPNTSAQRLL